jgi:intracellular sulfur oxidation DsrE/DsrF family protein
MLESSIHEDLIINIVVDTVDEIPPFIECLDNFLQNVDTDETGENVLFVLLADAVQKSCLQESLQPDKIAFTCFDTIGNSEVSNFTSSKVRKYVCKN